MFISKQLYFRPCHSSYISNACQACGKHLQGFPPVCLRIMTPLQQPQQRLMFSSQASGAGAGAHMQGNLTQICVSDMEQWPTPIIKKEASPRENALWWCRAGERWIKLWVRITLSCRRHYLMKLRGGFTGGNVCVQREGKVTYNQQKQAKGVTGGDFPLVIFTVVGF